MPETLVKQIRLLAALPSDESFEAPGPLAVERAEKWLKTVETMLCETGWRAPHVTASAGEVVFEWWQGSRKLIVYISPNENPTYLKVWGLDPNSEMEDGEIYADVFAGLWAWLHQS